MNGGTALLPPPVYRLSARLSPLHSAANGAFSLQYILPSAHHPLRRQLARISKLEEVGALRLQTFTHNTRRRVVLRRTEDSGFLSLQLPPRP